MLPLPLVTSAFNPSLGCHIASKVYPESILAVQARMEFVSKTAHLNDVFRIPIPLVPFTEFAQTQRMTMFISRSRSVSCLLVVNAKII